MRYRLLRGERILSLQGQWSLTRVRGGVLVDHQIALEPDLPAFLRPTYDDLNESNLRQSRQFHQLLFLFQMSSSHQSQQNLLLLHEMSSHRKSASSHRNSMSSRRNSTISHRRWTS